MINYSVFITPRNGRNSYGNEIDVSRFVLDSSISPIRKGIDSTDYDIGVFFFDDLQLKLDNVDGYLNDENDYRSIFPFGRDKAKVRVVYIDSEEETIVFTGLIADEATRLDITKDDIQFRVLSKYSIFKDTQVSGGTIADGDAASTAFFSILNTTEITSILNVDASNINPDLDFNIDVGSELTNKSVKDALNQLLLATNSVILVDDDDNIFIQPRTETNDRDILVLYGPYDLRRRQNIIDIKNYNTGKQRMFTSVVVNDSEEVSSGHIDYYGYRQKVIEMPFLTDNGTERIVAAKLLEEFKSPKIELEVTVPTGIARNVKPLDRVSISHPLRIIPVEGMFLPVIGEAVIGDVVTPLPFTTGSISIDPALGFKVLEIKEDPKSFETTLKLRQIGIEIGDGYFNSSLCGVIGYAVIGLSQVCDTGNPEDTFNPSVVGAAVIGYTEVS